MKRIEVRLDDVVAKQLTDLSFIDNKSKSDIIREALALYFSRDELPFINTPPKKTTPVKVPPARVVRSNKGNMDFIL